MADPAEIFQKVTSGFKITGEITYLVLFWIYSYLNLLFRAIVPPPLKSLDGEIMLITGSSTGIGRDVVLQLARYHPKTTLVLWDWNEEANKKTVQDAKAFGANVFSYEVDVTDTEKVEETARLVQEEVGDVTILFNNAGIARVGDFFKTPAEDLEKTVQVNLISHFWTLRAFMPKMIEKNHGHIVTTASLGAYFARRYGEPYYAAKFGIRGYIESLQDELLAHPSKPDKIQFTTIYPGFIKTPMTTKVKDVNLKFMESEYVAEKIIEGVRQNQAKVVLPKAAELFILWKSLTPAATAAKITKYFADGKLKN